MVGQRVRELRKRVGMTQVELSGRTGISRTYITQIERGDKLNPSRNVLAKLAAALGTSETDLMAATVVQHLGNGDLSELLKMWPGLTSNDRGTILKVARAMYEQQG